ncbi:hypothetical protein K435DRAFT_774010 [Dendrothele bispora CBS 962.96]|uniref:Helicase ATP-binding domain-containing protein n=1 Tax=Dendrothele bispora (strain CBS 962.96) TaxID=1314807 RepID=A0A4S8MQK0_DENBC|nr:hypothetical protein K435DRAFT_774010 [Dendrothele bispora CBS 962.96]
MASQVQRTSSSSSASTRLKSQLEKLRDFPVDSEQLSNDVLGEIYDYLIKICESNPKSIHWFCDKAENTTVEAATFLLRLFAYSDANVKVLKWKSVYDDCLNGCAGCALGLERVKISSKDTYFGAFGDSVKEMFWQTFHVWETQCVLDQLAKRGIQPDKPQASSKRLSDVPMIVVYRMICNFAIFQDAKIQAIIDQFSPDDCLPSWPTDPMLPAMMVLLFHKNPTVRSWASKQAGKCTVIPIPKNEFVRGYQMAVDLVVRGFTPKTVDGTNTNVQAAATTVALSEDQAVLWTSLREFIRLIHPQYLTFVTSGSDLRHVVTGHLHDSGPDTAFEYVLHCFVLLLKRLNKQIWVGEGPEYPQVVFDAFKDNSSLVDLLQNSKLSSDKAPWFLSWFSELLSTLRDQPSYSAILAKMADFMCEELQHERFKTTRPLVMSYAARLFRSQEREGSPVSDILNIHAEILVDVAFSRIYTGPEWKVARDACRLLLRDVMVNDVKSISDGITRCCRVLATIAKRDRLEGKEREGIRISDNGRDTMAPLSYREQIWKRTYQAILPNDIEGVDTIISVVSQAAHLDKINKKAFQQGFEFPGFEVLVDQINAAFDVIREGFSRAITTYVDYNVSTSVLDILRRPNVVKDVIQLLICPIEVIQAAAQALVGFAFDVDVRLDCFRAVLENSPDSSFQGLFDFLTTFQEHAIQVPEACNVSKSLVRCFTDIIEVLCSTPDGLLHQPSFLRSDQDGPASKLPQLWRLMCKAISVIFKRTPSWALIVEREELTVWMRDALIFGREMLAQRRIIQTAAETAHGPSSSSSSGKSSKPSAVGSKMVKDLMETLPELTRWLRLTDSELLYQSFSLLQSLLDLFRETNNPPAPETREKLEKHLSTAGANRLDHTRRKLLKDALTAFDDSDSDDEIEFVSMSRASKRAQSPEVVEQPAKKAKVDKIAPKPAKSSAASAASSIRASSSSSSTLRFATSKHFFTAADQQKLDSISSMPKFQKSSAGKSTSAADSTKPTGPKNDAARKVAEKDSDSSSDDSDEEESQKTLLNKLALLQKSPQIVKKAVEPRRQIKQIDLPNMSNNAMEARMREREAREARKRSEARRNPDISTLHKALLSWDYDHSGPFPPALTGMKLLNVPDKFSDFNHYRRVFQPLLLLECWSQIMQAKEEKMEVYECKILSRQHNSDWSDIDITLAEGVRRDWYLTENDIVLLRHPDGKKAILAKAMTYRNTPGPVGIQATIRCLTAADPGLQLQSTWQISKVFSLSTLHREYAALVSAEYYEFAQQILQPSLSPLPKIEPANLKQTMEKYRLNEPQAVAVLSSLRTNGFGLIQGPPGTGKTSTICSLVSAALANQARTIEKATPLQILICAPSNAAIDEIVHRLKDGQYSGKQGTPLKVVRVGADQAINISVRDASLDYLVEQKLEGVEGKPDDSAKELASLRQNLGTVRQTREQKIQELNSVHDNVARKQNLEDEIRRLGTQRMQLTQQIDRLKDKQKSDSRTLDAIRRKARMEVLQEADVICSTLSGAGHEVLKNFEFEMVIVDEAAQSIELSSLIPLKFPCKRCIMVGDPQQLPPTVLSQEACKYLYNQSLFVRLQKQRPDAVHLLSIQYRMHPDISQLPSQVFYNDRLKDGPEMAQKTAQPWHRHPKFGTYRFFNVSAGLEEKQGQSLTNRTECDIAVTLFNRLRKEFSGVDFSFRVGVVSMYRAQISSLKSSFERRFGKDILGQVDFNTVDGFQGQEKDIIILSCVRASTNLTNIGFLSDIRRMNVAITRARSSLFILGHASTLQRSNEVWRNIVQDAKSRNFLIDVDSSFFTTPSNMITKAAAPTSPVRQKSKKALSTTLAPIPDDLATPRDLKTAVESTSSKNAVAPGESSNPSPKAVNSNESSNKQPKPTGSAPPMKRKPPPTGQAPGPKRQKAEASMFIPKKKPVPKK